jgi:hypothetical protein
LEGEDDGEQVRVQITVLDENEEIMDVNTWVIEERESADDVLTEVSRNFFAQTEEGTVCYFGEEVDIVRDGNIVSPEGSWQAGTGGARYGLMLPGSPLPFQALWKAPLRM